MKGKLCILLFVILCLSGCSQDKTNDTLLYKCKTIDNITNSVINYTDVVLDNIEKHDLIKETERIEQELTNTRKKKEKEEEDTIHEVEIIAVGDNLIHMPVLNSGKKKDGTYDYLYMYENIVDEISKADLKVINQETILVEDALRYSSYPVFGSPTAIGEAIVGSGFNLITSATNHAYDKGESGILDTVHFWKQYKDVTAIGIYENQEDYDNIAVLNINGIKIACLNYTYGLNGFVLPSDKQYLVKTLYNEDNVKEEIQRATKISDFVIVFPHWGTEYVYDATEYQKKWAKIFVDSGADLIIGTHPHVVEPLEYIESPDGKLVPCFYSLGNLISGQTEVPRNLGGMAKVKIKKKGKIVTVDSSELIPMVTHRDSSTKKFYAYFLTEYSDELAQKHYLDVRGKDMSPDALWKLFNEITGN